ncbi:protein NUCLEAR FUSION DEFECTIVE 4-like [Wolffia australiana]
MGRGMAMKWLGLVTAVWVQSISGNNYTFSNYSDALKTLMGLSQTELNNLSVAKDVGKAFGILAGLASDKLPTFAILLIGSLEGFLGYGVQWLVVRGSIQPLPYWQMCVFLCMGGNSTTWMNTAVLVTCIRNFRRSRGPISGILKGYVGLSTAIFTDLCAALFSSSPSSFLLLLSLAPAAVCSTAMLFLREVPRNDDEPSAHDDDEEAFFFSLINAVAVVIAVYLLAFDLSGRHGRALSVAFAAGLLLLLAAPLLIPLYLWAAPAKEAAALSEEAAAPLLAGGGEREAVAVVGREEGLRIGDEHTVMEAARSPDFWLLFVSFLCGVGTGLTVMNNLGQIGLAMGVVDVSIFVSLTSIFGFFGRIASGFISEHYLRKSGTPRPVWNAVAQVVMAVGYMVMAAAPPGSLYVGSAAVGLCYGVRLAVTVATASELFGLSHYGLIYNVIILNLPLGSFLFSGLLAGILYDAEAAKDGGADAKSCVGAHCYRLVFIVMAFACVLGFFLDVLLAFRTKKLYAKIHHARRSSKA